jgi:hypothetical protein
MKIVDVKGGTSRRVSAKETHNDVPFFRSRPSQDGVFGNEDKSSRNYADH